MSIKRTLYTILTAATIGLVGCDESKTEPFSRHIDLNDDGKNELVAVLDVGDALYKPEFRQHKIVVSFSGENGYTDIEIPYKGKPLELSFEDMNGDGRRDISAILDVGNGMYKPEFRQHALQIAYQREDGSFSNPETVKIYEGRP